MEDTAMSTELLRDLLRDIMARDLLSQDMVTAQVSVITTEVPREFRDMVMEVTTRDLLSLDMVTAQVSVITTEVPREFKDMVMEVITRDLLNLVMAITMDMDNLMFTRTVVIIMDLMDMRLGMITRRDLLKLNPVMGMEDTVMFTEPLKDLLEGIMARDLLSLDMVTPLA